VRAAAQNVCATTAFDFSLDYSLAAKISAADATCD
jgi:hypothetical protein